MKRYFFLFITVFLVFSCEKEDPDCIESPFDGDGDGSPCNVDCDDEDGTVFKKQLYYIDKDGDSFGDKNDTGTSFCEGLNPVGYSLSNTDCNDGSPDINPEATQGCDGIDNDCDGQSNPPPIITFTPPDSFCSFSDVECTGPVIIPFTISSSCNPAEIDILISVDLNSDGNNELMFDKSKLTGEFPDYSLSDDFPIGEHTLTLNIENCGCSNTAITIPFSVKDCKSPAPICINGLSVVLLSLAPGTDADGDGDIDEGAVTITAADFIASSITDCSEPIVYSINLSEESANINQDSLILTCDSDTITIVEIHAWDGILNHDFCETFVLIDSNGVQCN